MNKNSLFSVALATLLLTAGACSSTREKEVEQEFTQYKSWVNEKADKAGNTLEEEWKDVKREYDDKTAQIETKSENLSDKSKEEYKQLKARFNDVDDRYQRDLEMRRKEEAMKNDEERMRQWEQSSFGATMDMTTVTAANLRDSYISFLEVVRKNKGTWSEEDWQNADMVYSRLNARKDELEKNITSKDELKIKALQTEFKTLQAARSTKDTYKDVKKDLKD